MSSFDLTQFLPYILNRAAEASSLDFQRHYRSTYGMLRTEWRVMIHIWQYGDMTAKDVCTRAGLHKTKVSRAVLALEQKRFLTRKRMAHDRRNELLTLTETGKAVTRDLTLAAQRFDAELMQDFSSEEQHILRRCLQKLAKL